MFAVPHRARSLALLSMLGILSGGCGRIGLKLTDTPEPIDVDPDDPHGDSGVLHPWPNTDGGTDQPGDGDGACVDADSDGHCDDVDNCVGLGNADQLDLDLDGQGDACDADLDGDGTDNATDACPGDPSRTVLDACGCNVTPPPVRSALWRLDESAGSTAAEATGSGPAGSLMNFGGTPWVAGHLNGALAFDGVDDYVQVGTAGSIRTLAFWVKAGASTTVTTSSTGELYPTTAPGRDNDWDDPEGAFSVGNGNASLSSTGAGSASQHWGGFHLQDHVPAGATVLGITAEMAITVPIGVSTTVAMELSWDAGATHTSSNFRYTQGSFTGSKTFGGADQTWGHTWTASDLSDANFRVRVTRSAVAAVNLFSDYLRITVTYADYATPRNILNLGGGAQVEFANANGEIAARGWPGAEIYVNGVQGSMLGSDWSQVVIAGDAIDANQLQFGHVAGESLGFPFAGALDEIAIYEASLTPEQVGLVHEKPDCL